MLTPEQNALLTGTGRGTPGGELLRRYWQPVALAREVGPGDALPVDVLGEALAVFRGGDGVVGLVGRRCPHRGVDLSYGRCEDGGLRCLYHGWLFAPDGRCLEQPGEPTGSTFRERVRVAAYPCVERAGLLLAYLGPGTPPEVPALPALLAPPQHTWVTRIMQECNYLQGIEGDVDPQHLSFLHRFLANEPAGVRDSVRFTRADAAPEIITEETPYGNRIYAIRDVAEATRYVRVTNFIMPNNSAFAAGPPVDPARERLDRNTYYRMHWHVPVDDHRHWKYEIAFRLDGPVDPAYMARLFPHAPGEIPDRSAGNRYLQDRSEQRTTTYTGMGSSFNDHDRWATESMGAIVDRSIEHLGVTDKGVTLLRKLLLAAIEDVRAGRDPLGVQRAGDRDPFADLVVRESTLPAGTEVRSFWKAGVGA